MDVLRSRSETAEENINLSIVWLNLANGSISIPLYTEQAVRLKTALSYTYFYYTTSKSPCPQGNKEKAKAPVPIGCRVHSSSTLNLSKLELKP